MSDRRPEKIPIDIEKIRRRRGDYNIEPDTLWKKVRRISFRTCLTALGTIAAIITIAEKLSWL